MAVSGPKDVEGAAGERIRRAVERDRERLEERDPKARQRDEAIEDALIPQGEASGQPNAPPPQSLASGVQSLSREVDWGKPAPGTASREWVDELRGDRGSFGEQEASAPLRLMPPDAPDGEPELEGDGEAVKPTQHREEANERHASAMQIRALATELRGQLDAMSAQRLQSLQGLLRRPEVQRLVERRAPELLALIDLSARATRGLGDLNLQTPSLSCAALAGVAADLTPGFWRLLSQGPKDPREREGWAVQLVSELQAAAHSEEAQAELRRAVSAYFRLLIAAGDATPRPLATERDALYVMDELEALARFVQDPQSSKVVVGTAKLINTHTPFLEVKGEPLTDPEDWTRLLLTRWPKIRRPLTQEDFPEVTLSPLELRLLQALGAGESLEEERRSLDLGTEKVREMELRLMRELGATTRMRFIDLVRQRGGTFERPQRGTSAPPVKPREAPAPQAEPDPRAAPALPKSLAPAPSAPEPPALELSGVPYPYQGPTAGLVATDFPGKELSERDLWVVNGLAEGLNDVQIAERHGWSESAVAAQRKNVFAELGVRDAVDLVTQLPRTMPPKVQTAPLSGQAAQMIQGIVDGLTAGEIGARIHDAHDRPTSAAVMAQRIAGLYFKLGIHSRLEAALFGLNQLQMRRGEPIPPGLVRADASAEVLVTADDFPGKGLSSAELLVLDGLGRGLRDQEISKRLGGGHAGFSTAKVNDAIYSLMRKLSCRSRAQLLTRMPRTVAPETSLREVNAVERSIIQGIIDGMSYDEIGRAYGIPHRVFQQTLAGLGKKLGFTDNVRIALFGLNQLHLRAPEAK